MGNNARKQKSIEDVNDSQKPLLVKEYDSLNPSSSKSFEQASTSMDRINQIYCGLSDSLRSEKTF